MGLPQSNFVEIFQFSLRITQLSFISDSFEDKRKENFDKGQAELDRRRKVIEDAQRKELV